VGRQPAAAATPGREKTESVRPAEATRRRKHRTEAARDGWD